VNDLIESKRYKKLKFIENNPEFRFYAGTPLTTENKINVGCFFVLDTKPRNGLTTSEKGIMGSLATLVVDYMKTCRQASEGHRAARLSRGLSYFVEGSSSFLDGIESPRADSSVSRSATPPSTMNHISMPGESRASDSLGQGFQTDSCSLPNDRSRSTDARSISSGASDLRFDTGASGRTGSLPEWITNSSRNQLPPDDSQANSWCFRRAANLLRQSLDLSNDGGVIFLEANNGPFVEQEGDCSISGTGGSATVLSLSTNDEPFSPQAGSIASIPAASLDQSFLQLLFRRYPKGKLWSFHRDGLISTSDDDDRQPCDEGSTGLQSHSTSGASAVDITKPLSNRRKATENVMLNHYFPNATQIMFVPLWNAVSSQWFAGCFCWTAVETQVFSTAVELSSVLGFGSSIMAEYSRVESLIADRQKGDFIGSISHELRSPLHGILAAAEFLNDTNLNEFQSSLLETVHACGRTLLDTMNQVLDFSKVVSLERTWRSLKRRKEPIFDSKGMDTLASHLDTYVVTDIAVLVEEVVEGICLGHSYGQNSTASADQPIVLSHIVPKTSPTHSSVDVIIDVAHRDWVYSTQPGALRRIIMNLFGNAMKYTDSGRVTLSLEVSDQSEGISVRQDLKDLIILTVSDTGKGISEEFLRGPLYTPFAQEDPLAVGTGLGLSIVRSLVKALNGNIRVRSRPGEGTVVRVSLPLAKPIGTKSPLLESPSESSLQSDVLAQTLMLQGGYRGRRAAIWGADPASISENSTWAVITRYLTEWFGMEIAASPSSLPLDILLVEESSLPTLWNKGLSGTLPPILIICHQSVEHIIPRSEWLQLTSLVDIIRRPCGPHKLSRSVLKCLQNPRLTVLAPEFAVHGPGIFPYRDIAATSEAPSQINSPALPNVELEQTAGTCPASATEASHYAPSSKSAPSKIIVSTSLPPPMPENVTNSTLLIRVLVVDDNRINLDLLMKFMRKRRLVELASAENGKLAVEAVERMPNGFDIIFMDMSMPVMNGFEATRAIRALENERNDHTPATIIALTGLSSLRDKTEALASGVDMFLTKPVSFRELSRLLDEWEKDGLKRQRTSASRPL
jgi:signal transduction histidine kinase/CheY-like chemotaxis protein